MAVPLGACLVCGEPLEYLEKARDFTCDRCGKSFVNNVCCTSGHYLCDSCHSDYSLEAIMQLTKGLQSKNPIEIMDFLMDQPQTHMHGPEHHVLVPSALLIAYKNTGADYDLEDALAEALRRGEQVPGGTCGFWGSCGASIGSGIFLSVATGSTPLKTEHYSDVNRITSRCLARIADTGGPRCCKRNSYLSILAAVTYVADRFGMAMELPERILCRYQSRNKECIKHECPFFSERLQ